MNSPYRFRPEKQIFLPPYQIKDPGIFAFVFEGSEESIQKNLVDPILSDSGKSEFELMFGGKFLAVFMRQNHLSSLNSMDKDKGFIQYNETTIFLIVNHKRTGKKFWFTPTMHLDSFSALVAGREVYGLPKSWGQISMPNQPTVTPGVFKLQTEAFLNYHRDSTTSSQTMVEINSVLKDKSHLGPLYMPNLPENDLDAFFEGAIEHYKITESPESLTSFDSSELGFDLLEPLVVMNTPGIFVKQLPQADGTPQACFQSLMQANYKPSLIPFPPPFHFLYGYQGKFIDCDSFPLATSLGVPDGQFIPASLGIWVSIDFIAECAEPAKI